jgi:2-amino-4-hydroxy-6-hydroxymethyldihydropteridine diphosphokinase
VDRVTAAVALGSNLGDRRAHLDFAAAKLHGLLAGLRISRYYDTKPVGASGPQPMYLNAAAVGETTLTARALLEALMAIEDEQGRDRPYANAPRSLDLDLILFGDHTSADPGLILPHLRFRQRRFVLEPLASIAPDLRDPVSGRSVADLLRELGAA